MKITKTTKKRTKAPRAEAPPNVLRFFNAAFVIINKDGKILSCNDFFGNLTGYTESSVKNTRLEKYFIPEQINTIAELAGKIIAKKHIDASGIIKTKTNQELPVHFHAACVKDGEAKDKKIVIHFISSGKLTKHAASLANAKEILKEKIVEKDKELKELNRKFELANKELKGEEKALQIINKEIAMQELKKSRYINELITQFSKPLNYITKVAEALLQEKNIDNETKQQFVNNLQNKAACLTNAVNFLYERENEKIRGAGSKIEAVNLKEFITELEYYLEEKSNDKILQFDLPKTEAPQLLIDRRRLKDILIEIILNAVQYSPRNKIEVKLIYNGQTQKTAFAIASSGIGEICEHQLSLFDKYSYLKEEVFSPVELLFPVFNDILDGFGGCIEQQKSKNKEDLVCIEVPTVCAREISEEKKEKEKEDKKEVKTRVRKTRKNK